MKTLIKGLVFMLITTSHSGLASRIQDEAAIKTIVESVASLADQGNFESLEKLYAEEIEIDYRSLNGGEIELKSPQALMSQWASFLPGLDRSRHDISHVNIDINGNVALASAEVTADHYVGDLFWQVKGHYRYKFDRHDDGWKIVAHTFTLKNETGNREIFDIAIKNATAKPVSYLIRKRTLQTIRTFLSDIQMQQWDKLEPILSKELVLDTSNHKQTFTPRKDGKEAVLLYFQNLFTDNKATFPVLTHTMQDPEMAFLEFSDFGSLLHVENGKLKLFRVYFKK